MNRLAIAGILALVVLLAPAHPRAQTFPSSAGPLAVTTFARGLSYPWSLAFLPDGRMLVTERPGRMRIVGRDGRLSPPLAGVPRVHAGGQAGLLDVRLDNDYATNHVIYFCYSADSGGAAAVARATLADGATPRLDDVKTIFTQQGPGGGNNVGCRIVQAPDGNLFVTLGDHFGPRDQAQNLANHIGKIIRIRPDGQVPADNPFVHQAGARPEIWAYGVRNPQGLAVDPVTGKLWEHEHGPQGGDEVNIIEKGKNYGWPVIGYGVDYGGAKNSCEHPEGRDGAAVVVLGAVDRALRHGVLHRRPRSGVEGQPVRRRAPRRDAGAARARRRQDRQGGTAAARPRRAHPRRAHGP